MESLNARLRKRLATICTANPYHAIPLYHKLVEWENENIIQKQDAHLAKTTLRGQYLQRDSVFQWSWHVCSNCHSPGHGASECGSARTQK